MAENIVHMALVVKNYDEAIAYYTQKLNFTLLEDKNMGFDKALNADKRWVRVAPNANSGFSLLLAQAKNDMQLNAVGNQSGGRVFLFLETKDFWADYNHMKQENVMFCEAPRDEDYATVVIFKDLYGNQWDLIEYK